MTTSPFSTVTRLTPLIRYSTRGPSFTSIIKRGLFSEGGFALGVRTARPERFGGWRAVGRLLVTSGFVLLSLGRVLSVAGVGFSVFTGGTGRVSAAVSLGEGASDLFSFDAGGFVDGLVRIGRAAVRRPGALLTVFFAALAADSSGVADGVGWGVVTA